MEDRTKRELDRARKNAERFEQLKREVREALTHRLPVRPATPKRTPAWVRG